MITMYDGVNSFLLPVGTKYAAYVNGRYANYPTVVKRFPNSRVFGIDVLGTAWEQASILDWENGDVQNPAVLRTWAENRENFRPGTSVIYCDRDSMETVEDILAGMNYRLWISTLDGTDLTGTITANGKIIVATQTHGGMDSPYDTSSTLDEWR